MKKIKSAGFLRKEKLLKINRIMRLTILMVMFLNLSLSATVFSQAEKINIQKKNATLKEIFEEIMQQSNYHFFYNNEFDAGQRVSIDLKNSDISTIVNKVLEGKDYTYKIIDNYVIIKQRAISDIPQTNKYARKITGIVKDSDGQPLPGVTIALKGTSLGVATDIDGKFLFSVPGPGSILQISFIGKKTIELIVQDETYFDLTMEDNKEMLDEVVCTGIQTISRERATGSFEMLNSDELDKTLTSDVVSRMQGKIAGLQIDQNNKLTIRGRGSILSNTEPLIVVDGFPIEGGLESVNPDDIANITILKDAAAASIWGVRAGNGVIVITTKTGKTEQKATLDVSYFLTVNSKPQMKDLHLLNASDAVDLQLEMIQKGHWDPMYMGMFSDFYVNKVQEAYGNAYMQTFGSYDEIVADPEFQQQIQKLKKANLHKQYEKESLRNAIENRVNLSLRGGSERSDYYISGVYSHQSLENTGNKNNNLLFNLKHNYALTPRLTLSTSVNVNYSNAENNGISLDDIMYEMPFHNLLDENGKRIQYGMIDPTFIPGKEAAGYMSYSKNLLDDQELNDNKSNLFSARLHAALKLYLTEGLHVETRFQYERGYSKSQDLIKQAHSSMRLLINNYTLENEDGSLNYQIPLGDNYQEDRYDYEAWTWRNQLTYNKDWNDSKHMLAAVLGHEMRMYKSATHEQSLYGYDPVSLAYAPFNEADWLQNKYSQWHEMPLFEDTPTPFNRYRETDNRDLSVYMNASYTYNSKYTLSGSGRIDQSNLFGNDSDYKYNFIWSTGLSWRISEEEFAKADWMDQLLFRFTYGIGGNVNKQFYPVLMGEKLISSTGIPYVNLTNPANKDLSWEKSTTLNTGIDFSFLNNRIGGSFDYYHKKSTDLLGRVALDPTNGFPSAYMNFASLVNQGVELTLNFVPVRVKNFTWDLGFNISYNKNKVTKVDSEGSAETDFLAAAPPVGQGVAVVGKPLGRLYAYRYAGLNEVGEPLLWENGEKVHFTEYARESESLAYMGTTEAPWYGGLSTAFDYKGLTLSANATYKFGHKFRRPVSGISGGSGYDNIAQRWRKEGDEAYTMVPGLIDAFSDMDIYDIDSYYNMADINVLNAAYVRLNEIALGYTLPQQMMRKTPFKAINIQFQVRNVALWTANNEHIDPETVIPSDSAILSSSFMMPSPRSFILGIKATF